MKMDFEKYFSDKLSANTWLEVVYRDISERMFRAEYSWCEDSKVWSTEKFDTVFDFFWDNQIYYVKQHVKAEFLKKCALQCIKMTPELENLYKVYYGVDDLKGYEPGDEGYVEGKDV